jgi:hypothetical protein
VVESADFGLDPGPEGRPVVESVDFGLDPRPEGWPMVELVERQDEEVDLYRWLLVKSLPGNHRLQKRIALEADFCMQTRQYQY